MTHNTTQSPSVRDLAPGANRFFTAMAPCLSGGTVLIDDTGGQFSDDFADAYALCRFCDHYSDNDPEILNMRWKMVNAFHDLVGEAFASRAWDKRRRELTDPTA